MKKEKLFLLVISLLLPLTNGCWKGRELNQRAFIIAIAFDLPKPGTGAKAGEFVTSIQIPVPDRMAGGGEGEEGGGGGKKPFLVLETTSDSVATALVQLQRQLDRKLFIGHTRLLLIGEDLAREMGVERVLDYFKREFQVQRMTRVAVVEGEAREILSIEPPIGQTPSTYVLNLISPTSGSSLIYTSDFGKYLVYTSDNGLDPILPKVKKSENTILTGGAGIIKDGRLVGWLSPFETRAFNILSNNFTESDYDVECPFHPGEIINVRVVHADSSYQLTGDEDNPAMKIKVTGGFQTQEFSGAHGPMEELSKGLSRRVAARIRQETEAVINKAKELRADILGIGQRIQAQYPDLWRKMDWGREIAYFPVEVDVEMKWSHTVRRLGK